MPGFVLNKDVIYSGETLAKQGFAEAKSKDYQLTQLAYDVYDTSILVLEKDGVLYAFHRRGNDYFSYNGKLEEFMHD